jgi:hypothetical protein
MCEDMTDARVTAERLFKEFVDRMELDPRYQ